MTQNVIIDSARLKIYCLWVRMSLLQKGKSLIRISTGERKAKEHSHIQAVQIENEIVFGTSKFLGRF